MDCRFEVNPFQYLRMADEHSLKLINALSSPQVDHHQTSYSSQWIATNLEVAVFTLELQFRLPSFTRVALDRKVNAVKLQGKQIALQDMRYIEAFHNGSPDAPVILSKMRSEASAIRAMTLEVYRDINQHLDLGLLQFD
jgi:hypothetical protein